MSDPFDASEGATPLDPDARQGLRQTWITYRHELNRAEQANVAAGLAWAQRRARRDLLEQRFLRDQHRRMFGDVWTLAGTYRRTERNIGIEPARIPLEVPALLDDGRRWIQHEVYAADELADGNGRHARLWADLVVQRLSRPAFTWGSGSLAEVGETRRAYIAALRAADGHDPRPLIAFARS